MMSIWCLNLELCLSLQRNLLKYMKNMNTFVVVKVAVGSGAHPFCPAQAVTKKITSVTARQIWSQCAEFWSNIFMQRQTESDDLPWHAIVCRPFILASRARGS